MSALLEATDERLGVYRHFREQGKVALAMAKAAALGAARPAPRGGLTAAPRIPSATFHAVARPPSRALVADFAEHVEDDASRYENTLPPALFPQWSFPLSARLLARTGLPLHRILNAGCRLETFAPLSAEHPIDLAARLVSYDDDGRRIRMTQEIVMRSQGAVAAVATLSTYLPLPRKARSEREHTEKKAPLLVPADTTRVATYELGRDAGRVFAALTGDVNPIHSVPAIARLAGFPGCILHGFGSFARIFASLGRLAETRGERLQWLDVSFVKPLVLPSRVGLFAHADEVFVGSEAGEEAFVRGRYATRGLTDE